MGEVADDVLAGLMCETCGVWMPDAIEKGSKLFEKPPGHPRQCPDCIREEEEQEIKALITKGHTKHCAQRQIWGDGECECYLNKKRL